MAPLIALVVGTLGARLIGPPQAGGAPRLGVGYLGSWPSAVAAGLALMFVVTGIAHFVPPLRGDLIAQLQLRTVEQAVFIGAALVVGLGGVQ